MLDQFLDPSPGRHFQILAIIWSNDVVLWHQLYKWQVVATKEEIEPPSEQQPAKRSDGINHDLANHLSHVAFKLALTEDEHNVSRIFDK